MKKLFVLIGMGVAISLSPVRAADTLPIGTSSKVWAQTQSQINKIGLVLTRGDAANVTIDSIVDGVAFYFDSSSQDIGALIQDEADKLLTQNIDPVQSLGQTFTVCTTATKEGDDAGTLLWNKDTFVVQTNDDGSLTLPEVSIGDRFKSYMPVEKPGVFWVEISSYDTTGRQVSTDTTRNGAAINCPLAELYGNGMVYLPALFMTGMEMRQQHLHGTVTLYLNENKTVYDTYDILTGVKVSSVTPPPAIKLKPTKEGVRVMFPNPNVGINQKIILEISKDLVKWSTLAELVGVGPTVSFLDTNAVTQPLCFYRMKIQ